MAADTPAKSPAAPPPPAAPDLTKSTHYVVLHMLDHHAPGAVVEAVDPPADAHRDADGRTEFDREYGSRKVIRRSSLPRLLGLNAVRPATEAESRAEAVEVPAGAGAAPRVGDTMTIRRSELDAMRARITELESERGKGGDTQEVQRLRARLKELEDPGNTKARGAKE